jgi:hypothetical protein
MVYCMTETNLWPGGPEERECPTNKGSAAVLPHGGVSHLRRTVAPSHRRTVAPIGLGIRDT